MDNQKHKNLNLLFQALLANPILKLRHLSKELKQTKAELVANLKALESMGLSLQYTNMGVKLSHSIDAIDLSELQIQLTLNNIEKPLHYSFSTASTNQLASNNKTPSIYITDYQSQGKGRQNKTWVTPLGQSVALSISHAFNCGLGEMSGLNIAIGVSIVQTIEQLGGKALGLKWPNDVLGNDGKVAGILIEASGNNKSCFVVIGVGINWNIQQSILDSIERKCMNIGLIGVSRTYFIATLIFNIHQIIQEFSKHKLKNIISIWKKYDCYVGENINVIQENMTKSAKYLSVDTQGYLRVEMQGEVKQLASGEVTIRKVD